MISILGWEVVLGYLTTLVGHWRAKSEEAGQHDATAAKGQDLQLLDVGLLIFL